jgi:Fe2+ or Zn2+ uptake regulation protein
MHDNNHDKQFKDQLKAAGERVTAPRMGIFRILLRQSPLPMSRLIARASSDGIDSVTVYRTVDLFRKLGLVQELGLGRNRMFELGDDYGEHHHHFTCSDCGKILDFDSSSIESELQKEGAVLGFELRSHQLEAIGLCAICKAKVKEA